MLRHKNIDRICCIALAATILLTCCFMGAAASGVVSDDRAIGYENRLFDQSRVHTIDIVMDDWDAFLDTCGQEVYSACTVIIDGEAYSNAAIRGKGNTSLSSVAQYGNDRYSFKIEFDQYQSGRTYHGLDKLSLNNLIQDKTWLKDYVAYTLMNRMGVAAPLCSFAQIRVNGEAWGFYLAVEGVEDSFLQRNYGSDYGELYKPDSMSFGGGRGNGKDFNMDDFAEKFSEMAALDAETGEEAASFPQAPGGFDPSSMGGFDPADMGSFDPSSMGDMQPPGGFGMESGSDPAAGAAGGFDPSNMELPEGFDPSEMEAPGGMGGMGSDDVKLQYIDDDPASYSNIFGNAKTDVTDADQQRLIASLKTLSGGGDVEAVVDIEAVIRYFVVHNFLCNDDSYTGQMIHNYYLYEEDGVMSMIPWDYNLAFGGFSMGGFGGSGATSTVNTPIDSLVSMGDVSSRPMAAWIFENETYTDMYHEIYGEFMATVFENGWFETEISRVIEMIAPYVEADENGFFTYDEFTLGAAALKEFCALRAASVAGQLEGSIPSTTAEQRTASAGLIDASHIDLSDMGEFGMGGGMGGKGGFDPAEMFGDMPEGFDPANMQTPGDFDPSSMNGRMPGSDDASAVPGSDGEVSASDVSDADVPLETTEQPQASAETTMPQENAPAQMDGQASSGFDPSAMGRQVPSGVDPSAMDGQAPSGFDPSAMGGQAPSGFDPSTMDGQAPSGFDPSAMDGQAPSGFDPSAMGRQAPSGFDPSAMDGQAPSGFDPSAMGSMPSGTQEPAADNAVETALPDASEQPVDRVSPEAADTQDQPAGQIPQEAADAQAQPVEQVSPDTAGTQTQPVDAGISSDPETAGETDSEDSQQSEGRGERSFGRQMPDFGMDIPGMGATAQVSAQTQWAMLIGSAVLLVLALAFAKFFKSNL